jgi:signal transduction histidine kinase
MEPLYLQILTLLTTPPGNLTYHLVIVFSIAWTLQGALNAWRSLAIPHGRRMVLGLGLLLAGRLALFAAAGLSAQGWAAPPGLLPTLDRAVTLISLVVIIWLWAFPEPLRLADAGSGLLAVLGIVVAGLSLAWASAQAALPAYNLTWLNQVWEALALAVLLAGALALLARRTPGWGYGLGMLGLGIAGHLAHLLLPLPENDYPGAVRLAQMAAYPLLLMLPQRYPLSLLRPAPAPARAAAPPAPAESSPLQDWLALLQAGPSQEAHGRLARLITGVMEADACLLLSPEQADQSYRLLAGYDHEREAFLEPGVLAGSQVPFLLNAFKRRQPLRLPASSQAQDLVTVNRLLNGGQGHLLAIPLAGGEIGGVLVVSRQTGAGWGRGHQTRLAEIAAPLAQVLQQTQQASRLQTDLAATRQALQETDQQARTARQGQQDALARLETIQAQLIEEQARSASLADLLKAEEENRQAAQQLQAEIDLLKASPAAPASNNHKEQVEQLELELRSALIEVARMQKRLADADHKASEAASLLKQSTAYTAVSEEYKEMLTAMTQELRQPMSSIVGYTDLLLGESVGILGALQRKFLERVKASTERMGSLIDEIIQITTLEKGPRSLAARMVDLTAVIDNALAQTSAQMRDNAIVLRVDLPDDLPEIEADQDALHQVLIHLLQNAGSSTPAEGEITLRVQIEKDDKLETGFVLLQVSDSGGGIPTEDIPRVFSRLYRADNALIPGLGDSGVGLSIAKTLVEALNGRVWVDTQAGVGSTFSVLLPLTQPAASPDGRDWPAP